jgi:signal transduction histidine kinase
MGNNNSKQLETLKQSVALEEKSKQLEAIFENITDGIFIIDKNGKILMVNNEGRNQFYQPDTVHSITDTLTTTKFLDLEGYEIPPDDLPAQRACRGEIVKNTKVIVKRPDKEFTLNVNATPIYHQNGELNIVVMCNSDITEQLNYELILKSQMEESLKMQEEIFANISHELKTPLNVIFSTSQLLDLYIKNTSLAESKDKLERHIHTIKQNCYRLSKLVNNIVDLSKIESGFFELQLSEQNIIEVIEDIVQSVSEYIEIKGLHITFDTDLEDRLIICDPDKIERVMFNLISNAIKFSEPGDEIFVNILNKPDVVEISVKDCGIGIESCYLDTIFERYKQVDKSFTRNSEGTGIGLCLVKSIVELHEGKIKAESTPGVGSKFTIELPIKVANKINLITANKPHISNVEMIHIEFSDIYS